MKVLWALYPLVVTFVVIVTGNHWVMDALAGAAVAATRAGRRARAVAGLAGGLGVAAAGARGTRLNAPERTSRAARPRAARGGWRQNGRAPTGAPSSARTCASG